MRIMLCRRRVNAGRIGSAWERSVIGDKLQGKPCRLTLEILSLKRRASAYPLLIPILVYIYAQFITTELL